MVRVGAANLTGGRRFHRPPSRFLPTVDRDHPDRARRRRLDRPDGPGESPGSGPSGLRGTGVWRRPADHHRGGWVVGMVVPWRLKRAGLPRAGCCVALLAVGRHRFHGWSGTAGSTGGGQWSPGPVRMGRGREHGTDRHHAGDGWNHGAGYPSVRRGGPGRVVSPGGPTHLPARWWRYRDDRGGSLVGGVAAAAISAGTAGHAVDYRLTLHQQSQLDLALRPRDCRSGG